MQRVSTHGLGQSMLRSAMRVQNNFSNASSQKASGLVGVTYGDLGSRASSLISTETTTAELTTWKSNSQIANDRVQSMFASVGSMIDQLSKLRTTLAAAKSAGRADTLNSYGKDLLSDLGTAMNLRQDGRYLFAGSITDSPPVDVTALAAPTTPSTADTSYYSGDSQVSSVRVSSQQTIDYSVTANGAGFENALRAANIVANMTVSPLNVAQLNEAYDLATTALDKLTAVQSGLGNTANRLESLMERQTASLELMDNMASEIKDVDVASATVKISAYQTQLEASYSALAKVNQLSLTKYL